MSMDNQGFLQSAIGKIGEFFKWLKEKMEDDQVRRETLLNLGLNPDTDAELDIPDDSLDNISEYQKSVNPGEVAFQSAVNDVKIIYSSLKEFIKSVIDDPTEVDTYIWLFLEVNTTNFIRLHYPGFYWLSQLMGFLAEARVTIRSAVEDQGVPETVYDVAHYMVYDAPVYVITEPPVIVVKNIWGLITDPIDYLANLWNKFQELWDKFTEPHEVESRLKTVKDAETFSQIMTVLAGFFTIMESRMPESRFLFGWTTLPRTMKKDSTAELKDTFLGNLLLNAIRKEHDENFPAEPNEAWKKIEEVLKKKENKEDLNDSDVKILTEYYTTVERWKRGNWSDLVSERAFSFDLKFPVEKDNPTDIRLGGTLFFVADEEISDHFNKDSDVKVESLGGLFISLNGEGSYTKQFGDNWEFKTKISSGNALDVYLSRLADAHFAGDMRIDMGLKKKVDPETGASFNLPDETGTRLAIGEFQITSFYDKDEDHGIEIGLKDNALVIAGKEGDGFLNEILPSGDVPLKFSIAGGYSKKKGFYFDHDVDTLKDVLKSFKEDDEKKPSSSDRGISALNVGAEDENQEKKKTEAGSRNDKKQPYQLLIPVHKDLGLYLF
jgi:hypothetical protein